eukprot:6701396-Pyramimonas_sp.AAC.1
MRARKLTPRALVRTSCGLQGAEVAAFSYVKRMRALNVTGGGPAGMGAGPAGMGSNNQLVDWADKLYNQGISAVTKGVKNLLSGERQLAVARVVEVRRANKNILRENTLI